MPLIGREPELRAMEWALRRTRLCSLVGGGGLGKTRLAREWAVRRHVLGETMLWCDMEWVCDARVARQRLDRCSSAISSASMWLVLDAVEGVLDEVVGWVARLLPCRPNLHVLVTSRAPLRSGHESVLQLQPLALPPLGVQGPAAAQHGAVALIDTLLPAVGDGRACHVPRDWAGLVELCRVLDGWPLALELAAGYLVSTGGSAAWLARQLGLPRVMGLSGVPAPAAAEPACRAPWWVSWFLGDLDQEERQAMRSWLGHATSGLGQQVSSTLRKASTETGHAREDIPVGITKLRTKALLRSAPNGSSNGWMPRLLWEASCGWRLFPQ